MAEDSPQILGIIEVPVTNLYYDQAIHGRQYSKKQVQHLEALFDKTAIDHRDHKHWIDGYVDQSDVASILEALGGSTTLQQRNATGVHPFLGGWRVAYTHGRHRVEASKQINAESCWTILLSSTDLSSLARNEFIQRRTDQFQHETPYTNGHIYSKLREYPVDSRDYVEWYMRLSPNKQKNFQAINSHPGVSEALDRLVGFPGIIGALYLGNLCKYSAWGLFDEFQTSLNHIYNEWSTYTRGDRVIQRSVTSETVKLLEGRAPATSSFDREWVRAVFQARLVFPAILDQKQRNELEKSILRRSGAIPSLRSCQGNMLYMGIAAQIVWTLLIPNNIELKRAVKAEEGVVTLRSMLRKCWVETEPFVEVREGEFQPVFGGPNFDLAFNTVIIAALRQFVYMSRDGPKMETGDPTLRPLADDIDACKALFHRRAKLLGFRSSCIEKGVAKATITFQPEKHALDTDEVGFLRKVEHRWGRPFARMFPIIQEIAFLPRLLDTEARSGEITEVFVMRDLVQAFLPPVSFDVDSSRPSVSINRADPQARPRLLHPDYQVSMPSSLGQEVSVGHDSFGFDAESTEMDVDSPLASAQPLVRGDEDVVMSDVSEPAESEITEGSHFWDQLILEYQSLVSASNRSNSPLSDASTLVLGDLGESEGFEKGFATHNSSSAMSLPSYSMVADQSRTVFDDSTVDSHADGSTLWSSSGSESRSRGVPISDGAESLADARYTKRQLAIEKARTRNSSVVKDSPTALRRKRKVSPGLQAQGSKVSRQGPLPTVPTQSQQSAHLSGCRCSLCCQSTGVIELGRPWQKRLALPQPDGLPSSSQQNAHHSLPSIYSTSSERSVLPSPSIEHALRGESQDQNTAVTTARRSGDRLTLTSLYTEPLPRSILSSPGAHRTSPTRFKTMAYNLQGSGLVGGESNSVSAGSQPYSGDFSQSGHSQIHSYSSKCSPILARFNNPQTRFSHQSGSDPFRSDASTLAWADDEYAIIPGLGQNTDAPLRETQGVQDQLSRGWQGFIDSDDSLTTISLS